jgi:pimeloyl-ACP methyl ester carboxylesterase
MVCPRRAAAIIGLLAALVAASCAGDSGAPARTGSAPTSTAIAPPPPRSFTPVGPDFYTPPAPLPGENHGDLIWAETFDVPADLGARAWRILYRSQSVDGRPIAVSGFVVAPLAAATTPRNVVAWAHPTVGSADICAPSKHVDLSARGDAPTMAVTAALRDLIAQGSVLVATDYEGLGTPGPHPYLVGVSEGRGVLDAVLAARQLPGTGVGDQTVIYGVSQGGHAALWAGELAATWAPAIRLVGVVAAAPFNSLNLLLPAAAAAAGTEGYFVLGTFGQAAANPALDPGAVLDPAAMAVADTIEQRCLADVQTVFHAVVAGSGHPITKVNLLTLPAWRAQIDAIEPGNQPTAAPILVVHGEQDPLVPVFATRALVARLCGRHDNVEARYFPGAGHGDVVVAGDAAIRIWIADRFAGRPAVANCP